MGLFKPSINSAVSGIQKAIDQLAKVEEKSCAKAEKTAAKADRLLEKSKAENEEAVKAKKIRNNIEQLIAA